ncbi:MAG: glycoside hydrolase family 2 protein, partial [Flavisolibacter sp.]
AINAKADGSFALQAFLKNITGTKTLMADIFDQKENKVASITKALSVGDTVVTLSKKIDNPIQWTSETPNLYTTKVYLKEGAKTVYELSEKFGFRTIEIRHGDGIYINGVQVKMKGINRHCFWPETGRTLNDSISLLDVQLIKEMNMNAVRCSHYPPDQSFLNICDSLGLYVLDELAGWQKAYSTKAGSKLVKEMVTRDANHPSIIFWSNGNEGGHNKELDDDYGLYDLSNRTVIHAHHRPGNAFNGIDCNHYEDYYSTQNILKDTNIYMVTEFLHSQDDGGAGSALNDFWELHWHEKKGAGGFIWALLDEGRVRTDLNNIIDVNGVNAPDGILGPHREKEGSFNAIKEIYSPVKIFMKELPQDFDGSISVENRYHFTNFSKCSFYFALVNFRKPGDLFTGFDVMKSGQVQSPDLAPGGTAGKLQLDLPPDWKSYDALVLSAFDPFKNLLYKWTWKVRTNAQLLGDIVNTKDSAASMVETDSTVVLSGGDVSVIISKKDGQLKNVRNRMGDPSSFGKGPVMVGGSSQFTGLRSFNEGDKKIVESDYTGSLKYCRWIMHGNGWLELQYEYELNGSFPFAGISFTYPENYVLGAKWLGKGPYRVWKNRLQGVTENVWQNAYNNQQTGAAPWTYPEFKGYYADISWMEMNTVEGKFLVATPDPGLYVRLFDFYGLSGPKPHPDLPPGNLSFLDCIPPIGTKLALNISANTTQLGPSSELQKMMGTYKRTLYFYFGTPAPGNQKKQFTMPAVNDLF